MTLQFNVVSAAKCPPKDVIEALDIYCKTVDPGSLTDTNQIKDYIWNNKAHSNEKRIMFFYEYFQLAEIRVKKLWGKTHVSLASIYNNYAMLLEEDKLYDKALAKLETAKRILKHAYQGETEQSTTVEENILRIKKAMNGGLS